MEMINVTITYLELPSNDHLRPAILTDPDLTVIPAREPYPTFYRFLYAAVGEEVRWYKRLQWPEDRLYAHLARPALTILVLYWRGVPAGFLELDAEGAEPGTEIGQFGIIPRFQGSGLGKHLLTVGVQYAFAQGASRVWLHTDTLDGPHALANYLARGFQIYRRQTIDEPVPPARGDLPRW